MQTLISALNFFLRKRFKKINNLKNNYFDESCYIFGDGVSIKYFDLKQFSSLISIISGKLYLHNDFPLLNSKYVVSCDPFWLTPFFLSLKNKHGADPNSKNKKFLKYDPLSLNLKNFIKNNNSINFLVDISNYPFVNGDNIYYISRFFKNYALNKKFLDLSAHDYFGQTLPTSIALAIHLGFKNVYLVGCDYTHHPSRNSHWFENQIPNLWYKKHSEYLQNFFLEAQRVINIKSITLDGVSKNLDFIKYNNFTNAQIIYKENYELLSKHNMNILADSNWFGYKI